MTFREPPPPAGLKRVTDNCAKVLKCGEVWWVGLWSEFSRPRGGGLYSPSHAFDSKEDAIGHAELWCGLLEVKRG